MESDDVLIGAVDAPPDGDVVHLVLPVGVPMANVLRAQQVFLELLREVSRSVAATIDDPVHWVLARVSEGSADLSLRPQPATRTLPPGTLHRMVEAVPRGVAALAVGATRPRYFTDRALTLTHTLAEALPPDAPVARTRNGTAEVEFTRQAAVHAQRILDQPYLSEYGTVEGVLLSANVRGKRQFVMFDELTGQRIECHFGHRIAVDRIRLERRVAVTGEIRSRESGEITSVVADDLEVLPLDDDLPTFDDVIGILAR